MKTDAEWLKETEESLPLTKIKLQIIGEIALKDKLPEEQK